MFQGQDSASIQLVHECCSTG